MLAEVDGQETSNGTPRGVSNGAQVGEGTPAEAAGRSFKVPPESTNGLSQNGKTTGHAPSSTYLGHDREEVTRILIQALADMGYRSAAESVSRDSGYELESPTVSAFRTAVLDGSWARAEELLEGAVLAGSQRQGNGLVLAVGADRNTMRVWLRQQKFLELLELREPTRALTVLRSELTPLCSEQHSKLHFLSSLLMCQSAEDLMSKADWDGAHGESRRILLSELSRCISPSVMLPEHRLAVLLGQVKESQITNCLFHTNPEPPSLYSDHTCDRCHFPSTTALELDEHLGELWQVRFSHNGRRLASCGMDPYIIIWSVPDFKVLHKIPAHTNSHVCNLAWSPDDKMIVTCGKDHYAKIWNAETGDLINALERFHEPVSSCVWAADCQTLITGSFDKEKSLCQWNLKGERLYTWTRKHRTEDLAVSPDGHWLVAMDERNWLHVYNFVTRELEYEWDLKVRPTSVSISQDSRFLLVNKTDGEAQLVDIVSRDTIQKYQGHSGGDYTIRSGFGGADESFVISGSDDGLVCIWHKSTGIPVHRMEAHHPRCNAVSWNPANPCMFATCGDDHKIKM
ncbi:WD40-repeat-containing domain protein [Immersiella caudata]|uniref:WD40-repeat-containing domain protein n=1 Tax=Immersiella caudata TaxID=314043 RepID=A0AA39X5A0_9PEZI|nr:WD40-repeat-containing domain protein [Immersiella caudata]